MFVSDAQAPLTETELRFLKQVKKHCGNFIFVLSKKDLRPDFETIIVENKQKIEDYVGIPQEEIIYIPISALNYFKGVEKQSKLLIKGSNFLELEKAIWEKISEGRTATVIVPFLNDLTVYLNEIDTDLQVRRTGAGQNKEELQKLNGKLKELQQQRSRLLDDSAEWQSDIFEGINQLAAKMKDTIDIFQRQAMSFIDEALQIPENVNKPEEVLNELVLMRSNAVNEANEIMADGLQELQINFEKRSKLNLYGEIIAQTIDDKTAPNITFRKLSVADKAIAKGQDIAKNSIPSTVLGTVIGGIIGGAIGLFGGIPGMVAGAQAGAAWGAGFGTTAGAAKSLKDMTNKPNASMVAEIKPKLVKFVSEFYADWNKAYNRNVSKTKTDFIDSLKKTIRESKKTIESDIETLNNTAKMSAEKAGKEMQRIETLAAELKKIRDVYVALSKEKIVENFVVPAVYRNLDTPEQRPSISQQRSTAAANTSAATPPKTTTSAPNTSAAAPPKTTTSAPNTSAATAPKTTTSAPKTSAATPPKATTSAPITSVEIAPNTTEKSSENTPVKPTVKGNPYKINVVERFDDLKD